MIFASHAFDWRIDQAANGTRLARPAVPNKSLPCPHALRCTDMQGMTTSTPSNPAARSRPLKHRAD